MLFRPFGRIAFKLHYLSLFTSWTAKHPAKHYGSERKNMFKELEVDEMDYLEFGVGRGDSFTWWVKHNQNPNTRFYGFDTFTGMPEKWGGFEEGAFAGDIPELDDRCKFFKGLFQDTLHGALNELDLNRQTVVHIDSDLYSAAIFVLITLSPRLKPGDIILFDEFATVIDEFRAWLDFQSIFKYEFRMLGEVDHYRQIAIQLIKT